jgi:hypothetical protein
MMEEKVWKRDEATGKLRLRSGVVTAFFLPTPIADVVGALRTALDLYIARIPADAMQWQSIGAASESWTAVGKNTWQRCAEQLNAEAARKRSLTYFELRDGQRGGDAPGYGVMVMGHPVDPKRLDKRTVIQFHYPTGVLSEALLEPFVSHVQELAAALPFCSGYVSPTLFCTSDVAWREARALCRRYPGYDVQDNANGRREIDDMVRGARWLTFIGPALVGKLSGIPHLKGALGSAVAVTPIGDGCMLRAGVAPELGEAGKVSDQSPLKRLAAVLEPHTLFQESALYVTEFVGQDEDRLRAWERRFLDG